MGTNMTATLSDRLEELGKAGTQEQWCREGTDIWAMLDKGPAIGIACVNPHSELVGEFGEANAEQIVLLHNNLPTIIAALRERGE